jgi:hypothetical protein
MSLSSSRTVFKFKDARARGWWLHSHSAFYTLCYWSTVIWNCTSIMGNILHTYHELLCLSVSKWSILYSFLEVYFLAHNKRLYFTFKENSLNKLLFFTPSSTGLWKVNVVIMAVPVAELLLGSWVRILLSAWIFVSCVYMLCCPV